MNFRTIITYKKEVNNGGDSKREDDITVAAIIIK